MDAVKLRKELLNHIEASLEDLDFRVEIQGNEIFLEPIKVKTGSVLIIKNTICGVKVNVLFEPRRALQYWELQSIMESLKTSIVKLGYDRR